MGQGIKAAVRFNSLLLAHKYFVRKNVVSVQTNQFEDGITGYHYEHKNS